MCHAGYRNQPGFRLASWDERFAMCSTFKLLLAGWMLSLVDQDRENLNARVHYAPADVVKYSPVSAAAQCGQWGA